MKAYEVIFKMVERAIAISKEAGIKPLRGGIVISVTDAIVSKLVAGGHEVNDRLARKIRAAAFKALDEQGYTYGK